jgi:phosphoribosylamine---glycine ligase
MKILVVGSGGREHAIVDALARNSAHPTIFAAPGNGGMHDIAELVPVAAEDVAGLLAFASDRRIDLTVVGPEIALSKGIVDAFRNKVLPIIGPTADQARLESSKTFAKKFFHANGIPTADFWECSTTPVAFAVLDRAAYPIVIKADGLAAGKGVTIASDREMATRVVRDLMEARTLGESGSRIVIEEFLVGEEASFHVFVDGTDFQPTVVSQDHKRRFDGDVGPNTGGMGAYSTDSILSSELQDQVIETIIRPTIQATKAYTGILYAGLMVTAAGPKIIEYNARFGDPETQVILPRLKSDLLDVFFDMAEHRLGSRKLEWRPETTATVTLVASAYPGKVENGKRITGLEEVGRVDHVKVFHAGTRFENGQHYTAGGRVLSVTAWGATLAQALDRAYGAAEMIRFEGKDYRRDIGQKGLEKEK